MPYASCRVNYFLSDFLSNICRLVKTEFAFCVPCLVPAVTTMGRHLIERLLREL